MDGEELKFNHVLKLATDTEAKNLTCTLLKSYLFRHCSEFSDYKFKLPNNIFNSQTRCSHCYTAWEDCKDFTKFRIKRKKLTKSAIKRYKTISKNKTGKYASSKVIEASLMLNNKIFTIKCGICELNTDVICKRNESSDSKKSLKVEEIVNNEINSTPVNANKLNVRKIDMKKFYSDKRTQNKELSPAFYQRFDTPVENRKSLTPNDQRTNEKKKRLRDKFAGLCKVACMSAVTSTPEKKSPLNLFLKRI